MIALGALLPAIFAIEPLWPFDAAHQTAWSRHVQETSARFAQSHEPPRVLFVGDSNVAFAIDGARLGADIGRPVFTCTGHASLGLDVLVDHAIERSKPGDVVVLMPCLDHFLREPRLEPTIRADWQRDHPDLAIFSERERALRPWYAMRGRCGRIVNAVGTQWPEYVSRWRARNRGHSVGESVSPYLPSGIDENGCVRAPRPAPAPDLRLRRLASRPEDYDLDQSIGVRAMRCLAQAARERGVTLLFSPGVRIVDPTLPRDEGEALDAIEQRVAATAEALGYLPLLRVGDARLEPALAYDTVFHLNDEGVARLHERLAPALREAITRR